MDTNITRDVSPHNLTLCSVVKAELLYGAANSNIAERTLLRLDTFFQAFTSLSFNDGAAAACGNIRAELEERGTPIGPNDLMIAAIALANGLTLVTHNRREFERVATLKLEDWESA